MARGGITVVGIVTGGHVIQDINTPVPHRVAVTIPADQVLKSKDLYRSLQQGKIFQLDGGMIAPDPGETMPPNDVQAKENERLRRQLADAKAQLAEAQAENKALRTVLERLEGQISAIASAAAAPNNTVAMQTEIITAVLEKIGRGNTLVGAPATEAVGGEVPTYMPDHITPEAEANITIEDEATETRSVSDAASRLRKLRQQQAETEDIDFG